MPALLFPFLIGGGIGGVVGFASGGGVSGASRIVKYAVIGGIVYGGYTLIKARG